MSIVNTIVTKASTEPSFYKSLATDFDKAIAPYRLTKIQLSELKTKLRAVRPPAGLKGFDDPILGRDI